MTYFEITVNGERRFLDDDVRAITLVTERLARRNVDRVSLHVGTGPLEDAELSYFGADLKPGDEISIKILVDVELDFPSGREQCSFCDEEGLMISLAGFSEAAICKACVHVFSAALLTGSSLPWRAKLRNSGDDLCAFCRASAGDAGGLIVQDRIGLCAECLKACAELMSAWDQQE